MPCSPARGVPAGPPPRLNRALRFWRDFWRGFAGQPLDPPPPPFPAPLKSTREALCAAQSALNERARQGIDVDRVPHWVASLQHLCDVIDEHRPLGPDGRHGERHTPTCGCES